VIYQKDAQIKKNQFGSFLFYASSLIQQSSSLSLLNAAEEYNPNGILHTSPWKFRSIAACSS